MGVKSDCFMSVLHY